MNRQNIHNALCWLENAAPCTELDMLICGFESTAQDKEDATLIHAAAATLRKAFMAPLLWSVQHVRFSAFSGVVRIYTNGTPEADYKKAEEIVNSFIKENGLKVTEAFELFTSSENGCCFHAFVK